MTAQEQRVAAGFKKGQSGNPGGRVKGAVRITALIREELERNDHARAKDLAAALVTQAIEGNTAAIREIMERIDGKLTTETKLIMDADTLAKFTDAELHARAAAHNLRILTQGEPEEAEA